MSLRGALGFAEAVSPCREIASLRQAQDRRRDPEKTSGQASKSPPRNDMPEQLRLLFGLMVNPQHVALAQGQCERRDAEAVRTPFFREGCQFF